MGLIRGITDVFGTKKKKRPKLSVFVVPKGSRVRFSSTRNPVCVANTITGGFYQDFFTQVNVRHRKTPRIIQYACIFDEGFVQKAVSGYPEDFLKLLHGLCYLYPQSINFTNGPCSYPGVLKAAQNHSENFTQYIVSGDETLEGLGSLPDSFLSNLSQLNLVTQDDEGDQIMGEN